MKRILIDLDTIFDTRLGLLSQLDSQAAEDLVTETTYWDREHTNWATLTQGRVTDEQFAAAWATRDVTTLQQSFITAIHYPLLKLLLEYQKLALEGMVSDDITIEINIHPYDLTPDELEVLEVSFRELLYPELVITFCDTPLEGITPERINERYAAAILYEFHRWIRLHCFALVKTRCRGFNLIAPKLFDRDPSELSIEKKQEDLLGFKVSLVEYLDIEFIDAQWFSMYRPEKENTA